MALTLLGITQQALGELGLPALSSVVGNPDGAATQVLALLNREGRELADREGGWPPVTATHTINWIVGQEAYPFPSDFLFYLEGTAWDQATHRPAIGSLSAVEWQRLKSWLNVSGPWPRYRVLDGMVHFTPIPSSNDVITIEYMSSSWCAASDGTAKPGFTADTDVPLLPDDLFVLGLKWRLLAARGLNYAEEKDTYEAAVDRKQARANARGALALGRRRPRIGGVWGGAAIPDGNWPGRC